MKVTLLSSSEEDTRAIGRALGETLLPGDVVALTGDLGAGKTVFCKGVGEALGVPPDRIVSPSFTIAAEHRGRVTFFHIDVYRLSSPREAEEIGLDEILGGEGVCVVEWAEKLGHLLPNRCIRVTFLSPETGCGDRRLTIAAANDPRFDPFRSRTRPFIFRGG